MNPVSNIKEKPVICAHCRYYKETADEYICIHIKSTRSHTNIVTGDVTTKYISCRDMRGGFPQQNKCGESGVLFEPKPKKWYKFWK